MMKISTVNWLWYEEHIRIPTVLRNLDAGFVTQIPLDPMHLIFLGVMKRLIRVWVENGPKTAKLHARANFTISDRLATIKGHVPREFHRKPRSMKDFNFGRPLSSEHSYCIMDPSYSNRCFLSTLTTACYNHFLLLHVALYLLSCPEFWELFDWLNYANELLKIFVQQTKYYYSKEMLLYNFHSLLHVAADVTNFGPLDQYSAFPFDNFLKTI